MGFYTDIFNAGNRSGECYFDADLFTELAKDGITTEKVADKAGEGETLKIRDAESKELADVVLHFNGDVKDITKNTIVSTIGALSKFPDDIQAKLYEFEQVPNGRREGVTKPPRAVKTEGKAHIG